MWICANSLSAVQEEFLLTSGNKTDELNLFDKNEDPLNKGFEASEVHSRKA